MAMILQGITAADERHFLRIDVVHSIGSRNM
jgi:hypothetical protein